MTNATHFLLPTLLPVAGALLVLFCGLIVYQFLLLRKKNGYHQKLREELIRQEANLSGQQEDIHRISQEKEAVTAQLKERTEAFHQSQQAEKLALQQLEQEKQSRTDWEKQRTEFEQMAKSSVMAAGHELSSKLLADHKREATENKENYLKEKQEENKKIRDYLTLLNERLSNNEKIATETRQQNEILWRTFSSPSSTGQLAEIGLENLLKNMGLMPGSDYLMQYTVGSGEGSGLRPDCVIKLPNNRLVLIDCKASKHVLAMAEAQGTADEKTYNNKFINTMRDHLKALSRKDYVTAIQEESFIKKKAIRSSHVVNVMYLPSSTAVELIYKMDPDLIDRSEKQGIILIGPGMLHGLIYLVSKEITDERKLENQERIIHEVERLLTSLASTFGHINRVGNSIKTLTSNFSKIGGSFNKQIAPKVRNLEKLGISPQGSSKLPEQLESYELRSLNDTIDLDPADDANTASLEDFRKQKTTA